MRTFSNQWLMNFRRLEYFVTLAQTGNLHRAGEIAKVSAPALSKAMKVLEEEVGVKLWVRNGRKIVLTDAGKRLLRRAPALIDDFKAMKDSLSSPSLCPRPIRIGAFEVFSTYFLTFLDRLGWNEHSLELHELLPGEIERYLVQ